MSIDETGTRRGTENPGGLDGEALRQSRARLAQLLTGLDGEPLASKDHLQRVVAELGANLEELLVAEEELRAQTEELASSRDAIDVERERYGELFEFAPDAYLVTDALGKIAEANGAAGRMLGVDPHFLEGKLLVAFAEEASRRDFRTLLNELPETAATEECYIRLQPRGRAPFVAAIRAVSRPAPGKESTLVRWMLRDVTSRLELEEEIRFLHVEVDLLAAVARVARLTPEPRPIDALLQSVVDLAASALPGCEVGLSLGLIPGAGAGAGGPIEAPALVAASGERARQLHHVEEVAGAGPCLRTFQTGSATELDLAACADAWPGFGELAAALTLVSGSFLPVETPAHRGVLKVFAFVELSRDARRLLPLLADQVATAVANTELYESSQALAVHLERALESRGVIERAKGVLIARQGCDQDQAFDILRRASQRLNRKLRDIATDLVANAATGEVPDWAPWTSGAGRPPTAGRPATKGGNGGEPDGAGRRNPPPRRPHEPAPTSSGHDGVAHPDGA